MLGDDQSRNNLNRGHLNRDDVTNQGRSMGVMMVGALAVFAVLALVWAWAPWSGTRTADNSSPGTSVGSSTTRPSAPMAPNTAPARDTPAAPSTTR
jgi:hypothetical protein